MSDETILTKGSAHSNTMLSPEAQVQMQKIHAPDCEHNPDNKPQEQVFQQKETVTSAEPSKDFINKPTEAASSSSQIVPKDEQSIISGLIEYLRRGAEFSAQNKDQADWFNYCSDWVKKKFEQSGLDR